MAFGKFFFFFFFFFFCFLHGALLRNSASFVMIKHKTFWHNYLHDVYTLGLKNLKLPFMEHGFKLYKNKLGRYFGCRFSISSTCSKFLKFSQYCYGTSRIQNQWRKAKIFSNEKKKNPVYDRNCIGQAIFWLLIKFCGKYLRTKLRNRKNKWYLTG